MTPIPSNSFAIAIDSNLFLPVVTVAYVAFERRSIPASGKRGCPLMQQFVISLILTHHEIGAVIVWGFPVNVMNGVLGRNVMTKRPLGH
jgi:hypothetical protein